MKRALRLLRVGLHLATGCAQSAWLYPWLAAGARQAVRQRWARHLLDILGVTLEGSAPQLPGGSLVVANHVSWLDAVALHAVLPAAIVAKSDARDWPFLGALLARNDTLFVERRPTRSLLRVNAEIAARLARGESVALFPEGTTTDGTRLLAFRTALFQPAVAGGHPVEPLALAYLDGEGRRCTAAAYINDMTLWESLWRIAALPSLRLRLHAGGSFATAGLGRRAAAAAANAAVRRQAGLDEPSVLVGLERDRQPHFVADRRDAVLHAEVGAL